MDASVYQSQPVPLRAIRFTISSCRELLRSSLVTGRAKGQAEAGKQTQPAAIQMHTLKCESESVRSDGKAATRRANRSSVAKGNWASEVRGQAGSEGSELGSSAKSQILQGLNPRLASHF